MRIQWLAFAIPALFGASVHAQSLTLFLAENAGYRYVNATAATSIPQVPPDWFEPGFDDATTIDVAAQGGVNAGDVKRYQWWYRDPSLSPCGAGFNLSNGLEAVWVP